VRGNSGKIITSSSDFLCISLWPDGGREKGECGDVEEDWDTRRRIEIPGGDKKSVLEMMARFYIAWALQM
jgi:hypothetical protein